MDLRQVEAVAEQSHDTKSSPENMFPMDQMPAHDDPGYALQSLLDRIPVTSVPGSRCSPDKIMEVKLDECILDAINSLHDRNVSRASITDNVKSDFGEFIDRDIGFIKFSSMVLWSLKELEDAKSNSKSSVNGFRSILEEYPHIGQTKISNLAKSFMWEPFFPVRPDASLFHVLLLFSKHPRLEIVPVMESSGDSIAGFITKHAVVKMLLESSGLEWFDEIAEKALSEYRFPKGRRPPFLYSDQTLADSLHTLWEKQSSELPVIDRNTKSLIGSFRCSATCHLMDDAELFNKRKSITVGEFIKLDADKADEYVRTDSDDAEAEISLVDLCLRSCFLPRMDAPTTNMLTDALKQAMENLTRTKSRCSYIVNESGQLKGVLTLRDIISEFAPPAMDASFNGGSFFGSALEQAGSHVERGTILQRV